MNVHITGAFGTIGFALAKRLLGEGHRITLCGLPTRKSRRRARELANAEIIWGDVCDEQVVQTIADDRPDAVIHCAVVLPPKSEIAPDLSHMVNVESLELLIETLERVSPTTRLIYPSSVSIYGDRQSSPPPRRVDDPVRPSDNYTHHKVAGEKLVSESGLNALILRLGVSLEPGYSPMDRESIRALFEIGLHNRLEYVHPDDVAAAISNALDRDDLWGRTLLIGGGETCRITYGDLADAGLSCAGIGSLPEDAFEDTGYYTDWLDTSESQRLLDYQRHSFADFADATRRSWRFARPFVFALRPLARRYLLGHSRRHKAKGRAHE